MLAASKSASAFQSPLSRFGAPSVVVQWALPVSRLAHSFPLPLALLSLTSAIESAAPAGLDPGRAGPVSRAVALGGSRPP
eukprot:scaffold2420_cov259-Pinguiococcus_pyrenoidosus.AAC.14